MKVKLILLCSVTLCFVILFRLSFNTFFAKAPKAITYHTAKSFKAKKPGATPGKATLVKKIELPVLSFPVSEYFVSHPLHNSSKHLSSINSSPPLPATGKHILISTLRI